MIPRARGPFESAPMVLASVYGERLISSPYNSLFQAFLFLIILGLF